MMTGFEMFVFAVLCLIVVISACIMRVFAQQDKNLKAFMMLVVVLLAQIGIVGLVTRAQGSSNPQRRIPVGLTSGAAVSASPAASAGET